MCSLSKASVTSLRIARTENCFLVYSCPLDVRSYSLDVRPYPFHVRLASALSVDVRSVW